jgi:tetratricopeptide (TPR) repeat protein
MSRYGLGKYSAAVPFLKDAAGGDPKSLWLRLALAQSCLGSNHYQCVLDVYREILELNAESAEADMLAGEALDEMKDHLGAIKQFQAAARVDPKLPNVHFGLGYILWTQNQFEEAASEFQAEIANVPDHPEALAYLGDVDIKLGNEEAARSIHSTVNRIRSTDRRKVNDRGKSFGLRNQVRLYWRAPIGVTDADRPEERSWQ